MACSMPVLRRVQAVPGTKCSVLLRMRSMDQCTAGMLLSGSLHFWSKVQDIVDMHHPDILHMDLAALSEQTQHFVHCFVHGGSSALVVGLFTRLI